MLVRNVKGFTLVELGLAMAFVGVLSISIVLIISNTATAYQRGITLTRVNSVGTDLVNDMRSSISNSSAKNITSICEASIFKKDNEGNSYESLGSAEAGACKDDNAYNFIYVVQKKDVGNNKKIPIFGAFCTGDYSYMWNSGYFVDGNGMDFSGDSWINFSYLLEDGKTVAKYNNGNYFRLIKVKDSNRAVCVAMRNGGKDKERYSGVTSNVDISKIGNGKIEGGEPIDLLPSDGGNNLALYDFYVSKPAVSASEDNMFYSVSFVLGTTSGGADILAKGNSCAAPKDMVSGSSNYCAINKFNFAMQVNGGK